MKLLIFIITFFANNSLDNNLIIKEVNTYLNNTHVKTEEILFVSISQQKLYHIRSNKILSSYSISSSKYGIGSESGSNKTPLGLHKIKEKHGENTPINGRMIGRVFYGEISTIYTDKTKSKTDDITSRILWLEGLEKGINKGQGIDSYSRYIYIHGTSEEGRLGYPASHGCIRMRNKDIIDLYKITKVGTLVLIL